MPAAQSSALVFTKRDLAYGAVLTGAAALYISILIGLVFGLLPHGGLLALAARYTVLLPALLLFLRGRSSAQNAWPSGKLVLIAALLFTAVALFISWHVTRGLQLADESAYSFQARLFRSGHIKAAPLPGAVEDVGKTPSPIYFEHHIQQPEGWFTKYPPGWPLLLALAGPKLSFLVNPILGLVLLWLVWGIGFAFGRVAAASAVLIMILSPYYAVWTTGLMSHASSGVALAFCVYGFLRWARVGESRWLAAVTFGLAAVSLIRPYTGAVAGVVLASFMVLEYRHQTARVWPPLLACAIGIGSAGLTTLAYNKLTTGEALLSPYAATGPEHRLEEVTLRPRQLLSNALGTKQTLEDTVLNTFPFMILLTVYALQGRRKDRQLRLLAAFMPALFVAYLVNALSPGSYGNRFYFEGYFGLAITAGVGIQDLLERLSPSPARVRFACAVLACIQLVHVEGVLHSLLKQSEPYENVRIAAETAPGDKLVVFLSDAPNFTAKHFNLNAADWARAREVFLVDPGPAERAAWASRVGRTQWIVVPYSAASASPPHSR